MKVYVLSSSSFARSRGLWDVFLWLHGYLLSLLVCSMYEHLIVYVILLSISVAGLGLGF